MKTRTALVLAGSFSAALMLSQGIGWAADSDDYPSTTHQKVENAKDRFQDRKEMIGDRKQDAHALARDKYQDKKELIHDRMQGAGEERREALRHHMTNIKERYQDRKMSIKDRAQDSREMARDRYQDRKEDIRDKDDRKNPLQ